VIFTVLLRCHVVAIFKFLVKITAVLIADAMDDIADWHVGGAKQLTGGGKSLSQQQLLEGLPKALAHQSAQIGNR